VETIVCLSAHPKRLPPRLLRTNPRKPHKYSLQRLKSPIPPSQHLRRRQFRNHGRSSRVAIFPRQNPPPIILAFPPSGHTAQISQRVGWPTANIPLRGCQRLMAWCWAGDGPDGFRKQCPAADVFLCEEEVGEASWDGRRTCASLGQQRC